MCGDKRVCFHSITDCSGVLKLRKQLKFCTGAGGSDSNSDSDSVSDSHPPPTRRLVCLYS